jgi:hypothetical protein
VAMKEILVFEQLIMNSHINDTLEDIKQYVEGHCGILWERALLSFFKKDSKNSTSIPFSENEGTEDVAKHLVYRYIRFLNCLPCISSFFL